jgi:glycosyltransferase involved in cell wall biosynthesis
MGMKRLKVVVSAFACNPAEDLQLFPGEDTTGWKLLEQLSRFHDLWVITQCYNRTGIEKALAESTLPGVSFFYIELSFSTKMLNKIEFGQRIYYYLWQRAALKFAKKLHKEIKFDAAHHLTFGNDWIPSFIGAFLPVPFIWGPVGGGQKTPKALFRVYTFQGKIAELGRGFGQWIGRTLLLSRKICLKKARAILVCNRETEVKIPEPFRNKVHHFPVNGISRELLHKEQSGNNSHNRFHVIAAGRLHRLKGFDIAIKAFDTLRMHVPTATFEIVGQGQEEEQLKKLVRALDLNDKVKFTRWLPREDLLARMSDSDLFLFPSFRDGGGAVVVEAMARGLPVVCVDNGGPAFHIQEKWGIKIKPKPPDALILEMADAMKQLYLKKNLRLEMGRAARKRAEEYYLWEKLGDRLQAIYEKAISNKQ